MSIGWDTGPDKGEGGRGRAWFCPLPHPTAPYVWCRRPPEHDGDCAAYVFHITEPDRWPKP